MQLEDKIVEDFAAQRTELQQREDLQERGEEELPEVQHEALPDKTVQLRSKLLGAVRMVLQDEQVSVESLQLPQHEERALLALQYAVTGHGDLGQFLYACDRRDLMEQALGVLQPGMMDLDRRSQKDLFKQLEDMGAKVADLRGVLTNLEEAQDEAIAGVLHREEQTSAPPADVPGAKPGAKPKPKPGDYSLTEGPEVTRKDAATTLTGADAPAKQALPTTLTTGPEVTRKDAATTLTGADAPAKQALPTTLTGGPDVVATRPPSSLGDPAELAEQAKQPWWRRPFG